MTERLASLRERLDLKYWAFRTLAAIVPRAPLWLARRVAVAVGALVWLCAGSLRNRATRNLAHIPALAANPARLRSATRGVFITLALNYLEFFRGRYVTNDELAQGWQISDWDVFDRAMRAGRGAVVIGAHMGPFEYAAWKVGELGYSLLTPAERLRPERFNELVARLRNHHRARLLPGDDRETLRELLAALRDGQLVMFAVDRWVMGPSAPWPLFGEPAPLPTAPFALAARTDAPVFLLIPWRKSLDRFGGAVELITPERLQADDGEQPSAPTAVEQRPRDREAAIAQLRQRVYAALERYISDHPEQWVSALSPVWDAAGAERRQPEQARPAPASPASPATGEEPRPARVSAQSTSAKVAPGNNR